MKVVHVSALHMGGAALAANRLHTGLLHAGIESIFISRFAHIGDTKHHISYLEHRSTRHFMDVALERYVFKSIFPPLKGYSPDTVLFTSPHSLYHPETLKVIHSADIIHLHWTAHFIDYGSFFKRIQKPVVWTLHDMNPFTGGCHYSGVCSQYTTACISCPQVEHTSRPQTAKNFFDYKSIALNDFKNLTIVTPSVWLLNLSKQSFLFNDRPHYHIRNGFNTGIFTLLDKRACKIKWGIPENKINLLFVIHSSSAKMKGFDLLIQALDLIPANHLHLTVVGKEMNAFQYKQISTTAFGYVHDENKMAELYNAADVFITPSLRDNLPNTVAESLLCGTPVLSFDIGGLKEMIIPGENGLFAQGLNAPGLAEAIHRFISNPDQFDRISIHQKAKTKYDLNECTKQYAALYQEMLRVN